MKLAAAAPRPKRNSSAIDQLSGDRVAACVSGPRFDLVATPADS